MVLQKYFDQWDYSLKLLGGRMLDIVLNNWNEAKCGLLLGEEPTAHFYSHIFAKYNVVVEEGLNTATQKNMQAQQLLEINQIFGREVFPPSMIVKDMNLSGRAEAVQYLQQQEQAMQMAQEHAQNTAQVIEEAKLKELYSKAALNISNAKERQARSDSNVGLFEERLSMISKNHSMSTKARAEALEKLVEVTHRYGDLEANLKMNDLQSLENSEEQEERGAKREAQMTSAGNEFVAQILSGMNSQQGGQQ